MMPKSMILPVVVALAMLGCSRPDSSNRQLAHRYFEEMINQGRPEVADELLTSDVRFTNPPVALRTREELKQLITTLRQGFPDIHFRIDDVIAEDGKVATRWTMSGTQQGEIAGRPPTGKRMEVTGMDIFHIEGGRIRQIWVNMDVLGQAQQLGWLGGAGAPQR